MTPALTVLQLDTRFPRVPGDVACPDTYLSGVEIIRIPAASVGRIVTGDPGAVDITPFADAVQAARGAVITTSCGFLAHWQAHLQDLTARPVIASALIGLERLGTAPQDTALLTFDAGKLRAGHGAALAGCVDHVIGLRPDMHLHDVITNDLVTLDTGRAATEIRALVAQSLPRQCGTVVLECTNLPPYKAAIREVFGGRIIDILTRIEALRPGTVQPEFL